MFWHSCVPVTRRQRVIYLLDPLGTRARDGLNLYSIKVAIKRAMKEWGELLQNTKLLSTGAGKVKNEWIPAELLSSTFSAMFLAEAFAARWKSGM